MAIEKWDSGEHIKVRLFGKEKEVEGFLWFCLSGNIFFRGLQM